MLVSMCTLFVCGLVVLYLVKHVSTHGWSRREKLGLILLTRNHADTIEGIVRGLSWLAANQQQEVEVFLVDNASTDGTQWVNETLARDYLHIHAIASLEYQKAESLVRLAQELCSMQVVYYCQLPVRITRKEMLPVFNQLFVFMGQKQKPLYLSNGLIRMQMLINGMQKHSKAMS